MTLVGAPDPSGISLAFANDMPDEAGDPALWIRYIHETGGTLIPQKYLSVTMAALVTDPTSLLFVTWDGWSSWSSWSSCANC